MMAPIFCEHNFVDNSNGVEIIADLFFFLFLAKITLNVPKLPHLTITKISSKEKMSLFK